MARTSPAARPDPRYGAVCSLSANRRPVRFDRGPAAPKRRISAGAPLPDSGSRPLSPPFSDVPCEFVEPLARRVSIGKYAHDRTSHCHISGQRSATECRLCKCVRITRWTSERTARLSDDLGLSFEWVTEPSSIRQVGCPVMRVRQVDDGGLRFCTLSTQFSHFYSKISGTWRSGCW